MALAHGLTIDLEDWRDTEAVRAHRRAPAHPGRIEASTHGLLDLLARHRARATFFILGKIAATRPALVREIAAAGHEIGSHGFSHRPLSVLTPDTLRRELVRTRAALEDAVGRPVLAHRCPSWSLRPGTLWGLAVIAECGFTTDASLSPGGTPGTGTPGVPRGPHLVGLPGGRSLREFPLGVDLGWPHLPFSGGFFLRSLPPWWVRGRVRRFERAGLPFVLYAHPWEFDRDVPRLRLPPPWGLLQYHGLARMGLRFEDLLRTFAFAPLAELGEARDWARGPAWVCPEPAAAVGPA